MTRRIRLTAALFAIAALLFAPLAMSLHACPGMGDMDAAMQAMAADDGMAPMDGALCERHCADGKVSFDLAKPPVASTLPVVPALRVSALEPVSLRTPASGSPFSRSAGPAPPLVRFTVLRI